MESMSILASQSLGHLPLRIVKGKIKELGSKQSLNHMILGLGVTPLTKAKIP